MINMFNKKPKLKYESSIDYVDNYIAPAKKFVPDWYKKIPKNKLGVDYDMERGFTPSVKLCVPFLDAMTIGYMITLPSDIYIKNNDGKPYLVGMNGIKEIPSWRSELSHEKIVPKGCYPYEYTWNYSLAWTAPKGYSVLATHPFNRHDLPFTTLTGIVDGGLVMQSNGNFPFFIKEGFEGLIPQGTPIIQLLPFRQEKWISEKEEGLVKKGHQHGFASAAVLTGWYKKTFWNKKYYD